LILLFIPGAVWQSEFQTQESSWASEFQNQESAGNANSELARTARMQQYTMPPNFIQQSSCSLYQRVLSLYQMAVIAN